MGNCTGPNTEFLDQKNFEKYAGFIWYLELPFKKKFKSKVFIGICICNFFARICTIGAPQIAEKPEPLPMSIFIFVNLAAVFYAFGIKVRKEV